MKIINCDKQYRVIETELCVLDDDGQYATIAPIFKVQMKFWWFWITIKVFDDINDIEFSYNEAVECYNNLVNPYKYYG